MLAAMLLCTEDTLSRPLPHVYQIDDSNQLAPVVIPEAAQQAAATAAGNDIGSLHDVRVKELRIIAQQQVLQNSWQTAFAAVPSLLSAEYITSVLCS